jgi:hypothetical protein
MKTYGFPRAMRGSPFPTACKKWSGSVLDGLRLALAALEEGIQLNRGCFRGKQNKTRRKARLIVT